MNGLASSKSFEVCLYKVIDVIIIVNVDEKPYENFVVGCSDGCYVCCWLAFLTVMVLSMTNAQTMRLVSSRVVIS